ncbi:MAG: FG-GAP-like repeat-containing protein [Planctomycetota bacterium]
MSNAAWDHLRQLALRAVPAMLVVAIVGCNPDTAPVGSSPEASSTANVGDEPTDDPPAESNRDQQLADADAMMEAADYEAAEAILRPLLLKDPEDTETTFRLATIRALTGDLPAAIELLDSIPVDHPEAGLPALGQSADWCFQAERYGEAERRYKQILESIPGLAIAHRKLAELFNRQGRRHEAAQHVYMLCAQGNVRQDELHSLIVLSDAMNGEADDGDPSAVDYSPIGASGTARQLFTEHRYDEAAEVLEPDYLANTLPPSMVAFYGRSLAEAQEDESFLRWLAAVDDPVRDYSEYWSGLATYLAAQREHESATRAAMEALVRDPTDFRSINRLHLTLKLMNRSDESATWEQRWKTYKQVLNINNSVSEGDRPNVDAIEELAAQLFAIDRRLEAVMWKSVESIYRGQPPQTLQQWNAQREQLVSAGAILPSPESRLCGMSLDSYPLPNLSRLADASKRPRAANDASAQNDTSAAFADIAESIGLKHRYRLGGEDLRSGFTMYHQTGGGVAVIDYDRDGRCDLYFAQGASGPPTFTAPETNGLFRQLSEQAIDDVTANADVGDPRYTVGCTSGDWNQDGFPDLVSSNIGTSVLWINNGDGSFRQQKLADRDDFERVPTSVAIADLNGDALPDLFELNYLNDASLGTLPERDGAGAVVEAVGPADFDPAADRIGINDGSGGVSFQPITKDPVQMHHGLGIVIADFDGRTGNEIFVGNDKSANQMWVRGEDGNWFDQAFVNGTAFSSDGGETASMGVSSGDYDNNGVLDLHITNFQNESVCLYLGDEGVFRDRAAAYRLGAASRSVLGFGTQSLDENNDGWLDLVVTNGHIDDYLKMSGPYRQKAQLFRHRGDRFESLEVEDDSGYWSGRHLGRALARLDYNGDGKQDFVVTHMADPSALLINQSANRNHWLQVELVGVQSERDAIGAKVTITTEGRSTSRWLTGGDGYLCRNESVVCFGLGGSRVIETLVVDWPSGRKDEYRGMDVDQRILIVESEPQTFALRASDR